MPVPKSAMPVKHPVKHRKLMHLAFVEHRGTCIIHPLFRGMMGRRPEHRPGSTSILGLPNSLRATVGLPFGVQRRSDRDRRALVAPSTLWPSEPQLPQSFDLSPRGRARGINDRSVYRLPFPARSSFGCDADTTFLVLKSTVMLAARRRASTSLGV